MIIRFIIVIILLALADLYLRVCKPLLSRDSRYAILALLLVLFMCFLCPVGPRGPY